MELTDQNGLDSIYKEISLSKNGYILSPREYILVFLKEMISLPDNLTAHIRPRTRFTRLGLLVAGQHCNSTYSGSLKIGLFNATDYAIKITPELKIAQIVFEELKTRPTEEKLYKNKKNAIYQNEKSFIGANFTEEYNRMVSDAVKMILEEE